MFPSKVLLSLILISGTAVDATPLSCSSGKASLSVATKINQRGTLNIAEQSRARAQALRAITNTRSAQALRTATNTGSAQVLRTVTNTANVHTASIGIGIPPIYYTLLIDTGSSNTWFGVSSSKPYTQTTTSKATGNNVTVDNKNGGFSGKEWIDTLSLSAGFVVESQSIGVADSSYGYYGVEGVLGLGPVGLTSNTVENTDTVPTVMDNLVAQKKPSPNVLGVYFVPASAPSGAGTLTFGGYDEAVITGSVRYAPLTTTAPAGSYWGIDAQSITYGGVDIMPTASGIVDTSNQLILIPTRSFQAYGLATGAGDVNLPTGLLTITPSRYSALKTLSFNIAGNSYDISPNGQIWPRSLNNYVGGSSQLIYLIVGDIGHEAGRGLDFIIGYPFLERYYTIFDADQKRLGFATTAYTEATTN